MARVKKSAPGISATKAGGSSVVVVAPPATPAAPRRRSGGRRRKASGKRRRGGRRGGFGVGALAGHKRALATWQASQPQLLTIAAAGAIGFLQRQGIKIPKIIDSLSGPANVGLLAWGAARFLKSPILDHAATGMLSIAAFGIGSGVTVGGDYPMGNAIAFDDVHGDLDGDLEGDLDGDD